MNYDTYIGLPLWVYCSIVAIGVLTTCLVQIIKTKYHEEEIYQLKEAKAIAETTLQVLHPVLSTEDVEKVKTALNNRFPQTKKEYIMTDIIKQNGMMEVPKTRTEVDKILQKYKKIKTTTEHFTRKDADFIEEIIKDRMKQDIK